MIELKWQRCNRWWQVKDNIRCGDEEHKSCWDCEHLEVASQPHRRCSKDHKKFIWAGSADHEFLERNKTEADNCPDYELCKEFRQEFHESIIVTREELDSWNEDKRTEMQKKMLCFRKAGYNKFEIIIWTGN